MIHVLIIGLILLVENLLGVDFHDFDAYQYKLTQEEAEIKIKSYLEKDHSIHEFYRVTPEAFYIGDLTHQQVDYVLHLASAPQATHHRSTERNSLEKVKIAIDPGHFGGAFAELEERFVNIPAEKTKENQPLSFNEGTLTYLTALVLKSLLEAEGAVVFVTRPGIAQGAIKESFFEWLATHPLLWKKDESLAKLFRDHYNKEDLKARAQEINAFAPDLTIIIHYNAHLTDLEKDTRSLLTATNYNLVFIPGAFCANELSRIEDRYEFLRLIVTDDMEQSLKLSRQIARQFADQLNVPLISHNEKASYIEKVCLIQEPGIYSRNLALTRLVHSPLCYGETLVQNNENEVYRLSTNDTQVEGQPCPKRVREVAQAYFEGIKNYFNAAESF
jgi:N-acetylmuramoyl-L-alanine amidase